MLKRRRFTIICAFFLHVSECECVWQNALRIFFHLFWCEFCAMLVQMQFVNFWICSVFMVIWHFNGTENCGQTAKEIHNKLYVGRLFLLGFLNPPKTTPIRRASCATECVGCINCLCGILLLGSITIALSRFSRSFSLFLALSRFSRSFSLYFSFLSQSNRNYYRAKKRINKKQINTLGAKMKEKKESRWKKRRFQMHTSLHQSA